MMQGMETVTTKR